MIANKHSQNDTVGRTTNQSWISLPSFILSADIQKQRITAKFNKISNHHQYHISAIHLSRCICTYPYFSKPARNMYQFYQSPSGPVSTYQTLQVFRIYKDWFEHENTLQNYQAKKGHAYNPEWILDDIFVFTVLHNSRKYCLPFTVSSPWPQIINLK